MWRMGIEPMNSWMNDRVRRKIYVKSGDWTQNPLNRWGSKEIKKEKKNELVGDWSHKLLALNKKEKRKRSEILWDWWGSNLSNSILIHKSYANKYNECCLQLFKSISLADDSTSLWCVFKYYISWCSPDLYRLR